MKYGSSVAPSSRLAVWKSSSASSTHSTVSGRIKGDPFAHDIVHEAIVLAHALLHLLRRAHQDIHWKIGRAFHVNFSGLLMRGLPIRCHNHKKIDIRIRLRLSARVRTKKNDPVWMKLAHDRGSEIFDARL